MSLTDRQTQTIRAIATLVLRGERPTYRSIAKSLGVGSTNTVHGFLGILERQRLIRPMQAEPVPWIAHPSRADGVQGGPCGIAPIGKLSPRPPAKLAPLQSFLRN